ISEFLFEVVPPGTDELVRYQFAVKGQRPALLLIVAAILAVFAASGVVGGLIQGFQDSYCFQKGRPFFQNMALSMLLVILLAAPMLGVCGLILFGGLVDRLVMRGLAGGPVFTPPGSFWRWWCQLGRWGGAVGAAAAAPARRAGHVRG